ncbi:G-protein coupled receptor 35-like isoform X1 [Piliocolobus tephrosceles]|uniref:G-protein coupled receptor 35-like n=3 Tax=Piliocolobus tephrosceles TaxID=591936 RepID=A0A8C9LJW7_9PRIM|nr:G-protein coupled receptor 35-like isoform X1 [Piliocolobus tephrosceles]
MPVYGQVSLLDCSVQNQRALFCFCVQKPRLTLSSGGEAGPPTRAAGSYPHSLLGRKWKGPIPMVPSSGSSLRLMVLVSVEEDQACGSEAGGSYGPQPGRIPVRGWGSRTMNGTYNTCGFSDITWPPTIKLGFYAYSGILLVLGLLLNSLALWVFCCRMQQWTETRIYMTNLAVADLCLLCALPFVLYSLQDTSDTPLCQLSQGIYLTNRYMSISLVTAIAVDRYVAVRHPLRARGLRSPRQAAAVCAVLWVLVVSSLVAYWFLGMQEGGFCFGSTRHNFNSVAFPLLGFYLPLAVVVFCSLKVVTALAQRPPTDVGQAEASHRAACMVWANLVVFVVCFLPLHVGLTVRLAVGWNACALQEMLRRTLFITSKLSDANCCLDAICYYYMAKEFQEASALAVAPSAKAHKSQASLCVTLA